VISVCGTPKTNPMCCCMLFIFYLLKVAGLIYSISLVRLG